MKGHYLVLSLISCLASDLAAASKYLTPPADFFHANVAAKDMLIEPSDVLNVRFYYNPELNKTVTVRPDGKITLDFFQGIEAAGRTPEELQKTLVERYSQEFTNPQISVDISTRANNAVFVTGEVLQPGMKELRGKTTVAMVLGMSQVNQKAAGSKSIFLIREKEGKYGIYKLNAAFPSGPELNVIVAAGDVLFVPRKRIQKADDFIDQYIRQLLPLQSTGSIGTFYSLPSTALTTTTTTTTPTK